MRLSIAIEIADDRCQLPLSADRHSAEDAFPLSTFFVGLAAVRLHTIARASEPCAHRKGIVSYRTSPRHDGAALDRFI
jgi:hypothetical protein